MKMAILKPTKFMDQLILVLLLCVPLFALDTAGDSSRKAYGSNRLLNMQPIEAKLELNTDRPVKGKDLILICKIESSFEPTTYYFKKNSEVQAQLPYATFVIDKVTDSVDGEWTCEVENAKNTKITSEGKKIKINKAMKCDASKCIGLKNELGYGGDCSSVDGKGHWCYVPKGVCNDIVYTKNSKKLGNDIGYSHAACASTKKNVCDATACIGLENGLKEGSYCFNKDSESYFCYVKKQAGCPDFTPTNVEKVQIPGFEIGYSRHACRNESVYSHWSEDWLGLVGDCYEIHYNPDLCSMKPNENELLKYNIHKDSCGPNYEPYGFHFIYKGKENKIREIFAKYAHCPAYSIDVKHFVH